MQSILKIIDEFNSEILKYVFVISWNILNIFIHRSTYKNWIELSLGDFSFNRMTNIELFQKSSIQMREL